jgi:hypothetical protein
VRLKPTFDSRYSRSQSIDRVSHTPHRNLPQRDRLLSTTLSVVQGSARLATGGLAAEIERLRAEPGKGEIAIGGATLAAQAAELVLIDEYRPMVYPVLVRPGHPASGPMAGPPPQLRDHRLDLVTLSANGAPDGRVLMRANDLYPSSASTPEANLMAPSHQRKLDRGDSRGRCCGSRLDLDGAHHLLELSVTLGGRVGPQVRQDHKSRAVDVEDPEARFRVGPEDQ